MALSENWARATTIARPWPASSTPRENRQRLHVAAPPDISMNGADDATVAIHVFELEAQTALAQLRDLQIELSSQKAELERKIKRAAMGPFSIMRSVLQKLQR